jgi:hypothetical protein
VQVRELAREIGLLKFGMVALDGTKIHAGAIRHSALSYEHAATIVAGISSELVIFKSLDIEAGRLHQHLSQYQDDLVSLRGTHDAVAGLVGIGCGVVSGVINLESSGVEAPDWRPRHDEHYHEA